MKENSHIIPDVQRQLLQCVGIVLFFLAGLVQPPVYAESVPLPQPTAPTINAQSYLLQEFDSKQYLVEHEADARIAPASITKLMSAYVIFNELHSGHLKLDQTTLVSEHAWRTQGSRMFVEVNKNVKVEDLIQGMIVQSGNDATVTLAELVAGSEETFASMMNRYAASLGMVNSHFANSTGLPDPEHYATARDIGKLVRALINEFPEYYHWYSQKSFTYNHITQYNRNKLLWRDKSVDGLKTGYTDTAGYCLVTSAKREDMRLISVVMGTPSEQGRINATQALLTYGFRFFERHKLFAGKKKLVDVPVLKGSQKFFTVGLPEDLYVVIAKGRYDELQATTQLNTDVIAPVTQSESYGKLTVRLGDKLIIERPLVALENVPIGQWWHRLIDEIRLWLQ